MLFLITVALTVLVKSKLFSKVKLITQNIFLTYIHTDCAECIVLLL